MDPAASNANDMVMTLDVAVIARDIVEVGYLAGLAHFTELLENTMDRRQGHMGMRAADRRTDFVGARMVLGGEQGIDDGQPLGCDRNPLLTTSRVEFAEPLSRVPLAPSSIYQPEFSHKALLPTQTYRENQ